MVIKLLHMLLGGHVERFDSGWGAGVTTVNVIDQPAWLLPMAEKIYLLAMHQDQVTTMPTEATRFLDSHFCHNSGFYIEDRVLGNPTASRIYIRALSRLDC